MLNDSVSESRDDNINVDNCKIDQVFRKLKQKYFFN